VARPALEIADILRDRGAAYIGGGYSDILWQGRKRASRDLGNEWYHPDRPNLVGSNPGTSWRAITAC
jgi:hypothetical protein